MKNKFFFVVFFLTFVSCSRQYHLADISTRTYRIEKASFPVDVTAAALIEPYKLQLDKTMIEVISINEEELVKGKPSSTLTNWFTDILLDETQNYYNGLIHFAIQNYGGIRVPFLAKGNVTVGSVYELMPFDNIMYIVVMKGDKIQAMCDKLAESGGWPVSKGIYFEIAFGKAKNIKINNQPIEFTKSYTVAVPDYIAKGGDNMDMFKDAEITNTGIFIRDLILKNLRANHKKGITIRPNNEKRIVEL